MKNLLINQPAGIGDILFLQKAVKFLSSNYKDQVYWPVLDSIEYIKNYIYAPIIFDDVYYNRKIYNFHNSDQRHGGCVIRAKYKDVGISIDNWQDFCAIKRNREKEAELISLLNLPDKFCFLNRMYGTFPQFKKKDFKLTTSLPVIEMDNIKGFNVFDWIGVVERASEIFTVDTSIIIIMDIFGLSCSRMELFARDGHYTSIDGLFRNNWNYN